MIVEQKKIKQRKGFHINYSSSKFIVGTKMNYLQVYYLNVYCNISNKMFFTYF